MARAETPYPIHGKIGNLIYKVRDGKQIVHEAKGTVNPKKIGPAYHLNKDEFAGAAQVAHAIYRHIKPDKFHQRKPQANLDKLGPIMRPYPQNYITAQLKKSAQYELKRKARRFHFADEFCFLDAVKALRGLDLSKEGAPSGHVSMTPIGPQHNPTAIKITGLDYAARAITAHGNAKLECRFHIRQCRVTELDYIPETREWETRKLPQPNPLQRHSPTQSHRSHPSLWIPVEIIPKEGITLPLEALNAYWDAQKPEGAKYLTSVAIEWREIKTVGRRVKRLHDQGIVRIASLHAPLEDWIPKNPPGNSVTENRIPAKPRMPRRPPQSRPQTPEEILKQAITSMNPPAT
jgi:hypothetical protein